MKTLVSQSALRKSAQYSGKAGLYCSVVPVKGFSQLLKILNTRMSEENIDLEPVEEMHCTVMYSRDVAPHSIRVMQLLDAPPYSYKAWSDCLDFWPGHDDAGYLVLKLKSNDLALRNEDYKDIGCIHSFPDYTPHITLAKGFGQKPQCFNELNKMLANLKFPIVFNGENVEDIVE